MQIPRPLDEDDLDKILTQLDAEGHAALPELLGTAPEFMFHCIRSVRENLDPAPAISAWRSTLYGQLVPIAHHWNQTLGIADRYPPALEAFLDLDRQAGQVRPQSHLSRLRTGERQALQQHTEGTHVFPLQVVALLSTPGEDFTGGEFVMTEQRPRMQSRPIVLALTRGDVAIIATGWRPVRGANGGYRVNMRHAISRVRDGERIGLSLAFHDAP